MTTIHGLPAASSAAPADEVPVYQGGTTTRKATVSQIVSASAPMRASGRLTLSTGVAVMHTPVPGATTIRYTPYKGQSVPIYNGSSFVITDMGGELSQATSDATKSPAAAGATSAYDMFVWNDAGTVRLSRGPAWTTTTTRSAGTALVLLNGVLVNNVAITNGPGQYLGTYVGSIITNGSSSVDWILGTPANGGGAAYLSVWNYYNRVVTNTRVTDNGAPYTYSTATVREARASGTNRVNYMCGYIEDTPTLSYQQAFTLSGSLAANAQIGIGDDSTTSFETVSAQLYADAAVAVTAALNVSYMKGFGEPLLGFHYGAALELSDGTANSFNATSKGELSFSFPM